MRSQAFGLAGYLSLPGRFCAVQRPSGLSRWLPSRLRRNPPGMVADVDGSEVSDLFFTVAGKGGTAGAALHRRGRTVVQIQNPRVPCDRFDLVIANHHDEIEGPNVLLSRTALHGLTAARLRAARDTWAGRLRTPGRPLLAALVGGANGRFRFGRDEAQDLARHLIAAARRIDASLFLTTSRRTGEEATAVLREAVATAGGQIWTGGTDNPYAGLIACSDFLVVTADSVSMVSEAVAGAAPVYVYRLPGKSRRIGLFLKTLETCGRIRRFEGKALDWPVTPLDDTPLMAREMCGRLGIPDCLRGYV
ncbi:mitochondrial fission ELM1 family protein [Acetobacter fallax]|uniref:Nucleoside-diphosphate sugar epimerase n=1 Tax=Acetobacter fallax TaxID=1737473 RepID=A0ABX0KHH0_9PROT|nr:mitochondrial fission ELM1 family protein [Acetobacter fallax]NHO33855.1 hypothetical protein [Acetobacter fallax]NHO37415.1 hypothetical protein [Acetobacter fallax]